MQKSKLKELCKKRSLIIYGNPNLIQETGNLWLSGNITKANEYFEFILDITNGRWFWPIEEIMRRELEGHSFGRQYYFMTSLEAENFKEKIHHWLIDRKMEKTDREYLLRETDRIKSVGIELKNVCVQARQNFARQLALTGKKFPKKQDLFFSHMVEQKIDESADREIRNKMQLRCNSDIYCERWKKYRKSPTYSVYKWPYFIFWLKAEIFVMFYAILKPNEPIDPNSASDIAQLCLMKTMDIFVSDDTKFIKTAFDHLYKGEKVLLSFNDFMVYVEEM